MFVIVFLCCPFHFANKTFRRSEVFLDACLALTRDGLEWPASRFELLPQGNELSALAI
jgi:hypothetical protein